jgi:hypothetical protein
MPLSLCAFLLSAALAGVMADPARAQPTLEFLNEPLKLVLGPSNPGGEGTCDPQDKGNVRSAYPTVFVILEDSEAPLENLVFSARVLPETGERGDRTSYDDTTDQDPANGSVNVCLAAPDRQSPTIERSQVKPFDLVIDVYSPSEAHSLWWYLGRVNLPDQALNVSGNLVVREAANAEVVPGTASLQLRTPAPGYRGETLTVILLSAFVWFIVMTAVGLGLTAIRGKLDTLTEKLELVFKTGWATNLTTAGALLGTFLSAQVLPGETFFMSKPQYITLNLLFALVILFVSAVHNNVPYGLVFLLASAATLGAGLGELATVILIVQEMGFQGSVPVWGVRVVQGVLVALAVIVTLGAGYNALKNIWDPEKKKTGTA